jgi:hypothetical protein
MTFPSVFFFDDTSTAAVREHAPACPERPQSAGLVSSKTSPNFEVLINLDRSACTERRINRLKRSVWGSGHLHGMPRPGHRPDVPWFVTLTYADEDAWLPDHVADATERIRRWCRKLGCECRYTWVAEIQPRRARCTGKEVVHYHLMAWLPRGVRMPKWDVAAGRRLAFWPHGMTNTERAKAGVGYLMKYLSKLGEFTRFPKGLRLYGIGGLNAAARAIRTWLNLPEWAKRAHGVGDLARKPGGLVVPGWPPQTPPPVAGQTPPGQDGGIVGLFGFFLNGCSASEARQAEGKRRGAVGKPRTPQGPSTGLSCGRVALSTAGGCATVSSSSPA